MAATAVYCTIAPIDPNSPSVTFSNISSTTAQFHLAGGQYCISVIGATFGDVTLEMLGADGSTYVTAPGVTAFSANGAQVATLAPGYYKLALS